jgi:hypothetical protein
MTQREDWGELEQLDEKIGRLEGEVTRLNRALRRANITIDVLRRHADDDQHAQDEIDAALKEDADVQTAQRRRA